MFKGPVSFQQFSPPRGMKSEQLAGLLVKQINEDRAKFNKLITELERTAAGSSTVVILGSSTSSGGSSGGGIASLDAVIKTGAAIIEGNNTITFDRTVTGASVVVLMWAYDSSFYKLDVRPLTNPTNANFQIYSPVAGFIDYVAFAG